MVFRAKRAMAKRRIQLSSSVLGYSSIRLAISRLSSGLRVEEKTIWEACKSEKLPP